MRSVHTQIAFTLFKILKRLIVTWNLNKEARFTFYPS
jgi:hypothetical protein